MTGSLRTALLLRTGLATALVLVASGALLYALVRGDVRRRFDRSLEEKAMLLSSAVTIGRDGVEIELSDGRGEDLAAVSGTDYLVLRDDGGNVDYRSPSLDGGDLPVVEASPGSATFEDLELPGDRDGRAVVVAFTPHPDDDTPVATLTPAPTLTLVVARDTEDMARFLRRFGGMLAGVVLITVLAMGVTITVAIGGALRPVGALTDRIAGLGARDLRERLPVTGVPAELGPIVTRLNELLSRLETAFAREQAFSANVAHELRTPLAGLRNGLEVARSRPRTAAEYEEALDVCAATSSHLQALVEKLLLLARLEAGAVDMHRQPIRLADAVEGVWAPLRDAAAARDLTLRVSDAGDTTVIGDPILLETAVRNVAENAVAYADAGGSIVCHVRSTADTAVINIANTGCELTQSEADALSDRFRRGDRARTVGDDHHVGLGLSLARSSVAILGGQLTIRVPGDGTWEAIVSLPRAPGDGSPA